MSKTELQKFSPSEAQTLVTLAGCVWFMVRTAVASTAINKGSVKITAEEQKLIETHLLKQLEPLIEDD